MAIDAIDPPTPTAADKSYDLGSQPAWCDSSVRRHVDDMRKQGQGAQQIPMAGPADSDRIPADLRHHDS